MVAISRPPTGKNDPRPSGPVSELSFSIVNCANSVIDFDGFEENTSPGACEVEPPGMPKGPCSMTSVFVQPNCASSSARLAPTMPAPMMMTRGAECGIACSLKVQKVRNGVAFDARTVPVDSRVAPRSQASMTRSDFAVEQQGRNLPASISRARIPP